MDIITYALLSKRLKAVEAIAGKLPIHICTSGEYDAETGQPTIQNPDVEIFYLVPDGTGTNLYTEWVYTGNAWEEFGSGSGGGVSDVQINGTSVVSDGVANVPIAAVGVRGVVSVNNSYGLYMRNDGTVAIYGAPENDYKSGYMSSRAACLDMLDRAAFYGLAKAAGADMKDIASVTVGTYPQAQKNAIHSMLGTQDFVEVGFVQNVSGTTPSITGEANYRYICGEVSTISITPPNAGTIDVLFESGSTAAVLTVPSTVKFPAWFDPNNLETNTIYELLIQDGVYGSVMTWAL